MNHAIENGFDVIEAAEIYCPDPFSEGFSDCYTNPQNLRGPGVALYAEAAQEQMNSLT